MCLTVDSKLSHARDLTVVLNYKDRREHLFHMPNLLSAFIDVFVSEILAVPLYDNRDYSRENRALFPTHYHDQDCDLTLIITQALCDSIKD